MCNEIVYSHQGWIRMSLCRISATEETAAIERKLSNHMRWYQGRHL